MPHNVTLHIIQLVNQLTNGFFKSPMTVTRATAVTPVAALTAVKSEGQEQAAVVRPPWSFSLKFHSIQAWWAHTNPHNTSEADPIWEFTHIWQASSYGQRQPSISWLNEWTQNHQIRCLSYHPAVHSEANELYIALEHRLTFRTWSKVKWPLQVGKKRILKDTRKKGGPWQTSFQVMPPRFHMTLLKSTYQPLMSSLSVHLRHLQLFKRPTIPVLQRWPCVVWIDRWLVKGWCRFCTMRRCPGLGSRVIDVIDVLPAAVHLSRHLDRPKYDFVYLPWAMRKACNIGLAFFGKKSALIRFAQQQQRDELSRLLSIFSEVYQLRGSHRLHGILRGPAATTRAFAAWPQHVTGCTLATGTVYITIFNGTYPIAKTYWNIETVSSESFQFSEIVWTGELLGLGLLSGLVLMFGTSVQRHCRAEAGFSAQLESDYQPASDQLVQDLTWKTPWRNGAQAIHVLHCVAVVSFRLK